MTESNSKNNKKKLVILQVLPKLSSGGVERGTIEVAKALVEAGHESIVASAGGTMVYHLDNMGAKHIELPLHSKNPFVILKNARKLAKIIKKENVDIVHARSRAPAWSALLACRKTGCLFLTTFHGVYSFGGKIKHWYNSVMVRSDRIISASEYIKNHMLRNYSVSDDKITVIPRGADLEQFDRDKVPERRLVQMAENLNVELDKTVILLPGRLTEWKGHEFLLDALALLPKNSFICIFAGDDKNHKKYRKRIFKKMKALDLQGNIHIVRHVNDMPALYSSVDIVVSASMRPEAFGRVAIEAQAMERLLVATKHGGSIETVIDKKTGWLVKPGDVNELAEALEAALNISDAKRKTMTTAAKKNVTDNFSLTNMTSKTLALYDEMIADKEQGS